MKKIKNLFLYILLFSVILGNMKIVYAEESTGITTTSKGAVLIEARSGNVLYESGGNDKLSPASITKIMTLLLIFDALEEGKITMDEMVTTSAYAKSMGGSQVYLEEGEQQCVETMIKCIVIASGNDASVAMAEHLAGSEGVFVEMMNQKAADLGMMNTHFEDCSGLTDSDNHYTTAMDVAIASRELINKYPKCLEYSSIWMETIIHKTNKGESEFVLSNTNKMLKSYDFVKGLKTGSTSKAKYCVSAVGEKDGMTLIAVVMGAPDYKVRFAEAGELLNYGFANCKIYSDEKNNGNLKVDGGELEYIDYEMKQPFYYSGIDDNILNIKKKIELNKVKLPVKKGDSVGKVIYTMNGKEIGMCDLVSKNDVKKSTYFYELKTLFMEFLNL